jgi:hypothetical protein
MNAASVVPAGAAPPRRPATRRPRQVTIAASQTTALACRLDAAPRGDFQAFLERVDQQKDEQADGERQHELEAAPAHPFQRWEEHQAERNRHDATNRPTTP